MRGLQEFSINIVASLATRFWDHYSTLSRLLLNHGKEQEEKENQAKARTPEAADAAAVEFAR
jgi:hypothetical protein